MACKLLRKLKRAMRVSSSAERYLSKSIDLADFAYREKRLKEKGLL